MLEPDCLISADTACTGEEVQERAISPKLLEAYGSQEKIREQLSIVLDAARASKERLDQTLLFGPPGLGQ